MLLDLVSFASALAAPLAALTSALAAPLASLAAALAAAALAAAVVMTASAKRASADDWEPDLDALERDAANGDPEAQYQLSMILKEGSLTERDLARSTDLLLRAAAREHPDAMLELAYRYHDGEGLPKDPDLAARWMVLALALAEDEEEAEEEDEDEDDDEDEGDSGSPSSRPFVLSDSDFNELMVSVGVDVKELYRRLKESAKTGRRLSVQEALPPKVYRALLERVMEAEGLGVPEPPGGFRSPSAKPPFRPSPGLSDPDERLELQRMLRLSGMDELETSLILADRYAFGEGVEVDLDEAFGHTRLAAKLGDVGAALNAGMMLLAGDGTLPDFEEATPLLRRALALDHPQTPFALWHVSTQRPDLVSPEEGLEFLKLSADMNFPAAMASLAAGPPSGDLKSLVQEARRGGLDFVYMLAERYRQGPPEERDQDKAMVLYKRAAKKGHLKAARTLQRIYRIGAGVPRNQREADKWRRLGDRLEEEMSRREEPVEEAAQKPAEKAAKKPAKQPSKTPAKQPAKTPAKQPAKKPKTASGKKPGEK
jgi:TPR repeat protein